MKTKILNTTCSILLLIFLSAFGFQDNPPPSGWYQQFMPDLGGKKIIDIDFVDSLTGFAIASKNLNPDTSIILKTNNGGDNWSIVFQEGRRRFSRVIFINENTGFVSGGIPGVAYLYKTTDSGNSWFNISSISCAYWDDMSVVNEDTIYTVDYDGFCGGVFRTINGGSNWIRTANFGGSNPNKIYMYNGSLGFVSRGSQPLLRTTDGGFTWHEVGSAGGFTDMVFADSLTGWKAFGSIMKTTNGGTNWNAQILPQFNWINGAITLKLINEDTLWATGGVIQWVPNQNNYRGVVYKTTNSGISWGYQIPDTNISYYNFTLLDFSDKNNGWVYLPIGFGFHTKVGGNDTTFYTGIVNISNEVPSHFKLHQNYPNPFNPRTVIRYELTKSADVTLKVYDVTGREYMTLVNQFHRAGVYEVDFMGKFSASGVYFYRLSAGDFSETKRMLLVK